MFPADQICFLRTDQLWMCTARVLGRLSTFLGAAIRPTTRTTYVSPYAASPGRYGAGPPLALLRDHTRLYVTDILRTQDLTGMELADWLSADYREPMESA